MWDCALCTWDMLDTEAARERITVFADPAELVALVPVDGDAAPALAALRRASTAAVAAEYSCLALVAVPTLAAAAAGRLFAAEPEGIDGWTILERDFSAKEDTGAGSTIDEGAANAVER